MLETICAVNVSEKEGAEGAEGAEGYIARTAL